MSADVQSWAAIEIAAQSSESKTEGLRRPTRVGPAVAGGVALWAIVISGLTLLASHQDAIRTLLAP